MLKQISDKLLIRSLSGSQTSDFSVAFGAETSVSYPDGVFFYIVEESSTTDRYRVIDGRGFGQITPTTATRATTKIGPWASIVNAAGDIIEVTQQVDPNPANGAIYLRKIAHPTYTSVTNVRLQVIDLNSPVYTRAVYDPVNDRTIVAAAIDTATPHGFRIAVVDNALSNVGLQGIVAGGSLVKGPIIGFDNVNQHVAIISASFVIPNYFYKYSLYSADLSTTLINFQNILSAIPASSPAATSFSDGPVAITFDSSTNEFIVVHQVQTSSPTGAGSFSHDVRVFKLSNSSATINSGPTTVYSVAATGTARLNEQAGQDVVIVNGKLVIPLEVIDYPGNNSKLLVLDKSTLAVLQTIDLGAPGRVRLSVRNTNRLAVLHEEVTGGNSKLYLKTFWDDATSIPPLGIRLRDPSSGSSGLTNHWTVTLDIGSANTAASQYLMSESQATNPNTTNPLLFQTTAPTQFSLSHANGIKTVYAWYTNPTTSLWPSISTISLFAPLSTSDKTFDLSADLLSTSSRTYGLSAEFIGSHTKTHSLSATLFGSSSVTYGLSADLLSVRDKTYGLSAELQSTNTNTYGSSSFSVHVVSKTFQSSSELLKTSQNSFSSSSRLFSLQLGALFDVKDTDSGSNLFTNSNIVSTNVVCISPGIVGFLISETATNRSAAMAETFATTIPQTFLLSEPDGLKTIYFWTRDALTVSTVHETDAITLDRIVDVNLQFALKDRFSGSQRYAKNRLVSTDISTPGTENGSVFFLLSETQVTAPDVTDNRFVASAPLTIQLSALDGIKTAYLWCKDSAGNMINNSARITLVQSIDLQALSLNVFDRTTGSTTLTDSRIISTVVTATVN